VIDLGAHVLDLARVFLGEVEQIGAETQRRNSAVNGEDTATMLLKHVSGGVSVVECTYESHRLPDPFPETLIEIEGSNGAMAIRRGLRLELTSGGEMKEIDVDPPVLEWRAARGMSFRKAFWRPARTSSTPCKPGVRRRRQRKTT
jgi:predicted dehydrogenase